MNRDGRTVVELSVLVADKLRLDVRERRRVEFAARLRAVGKSAIPKEIVDKPGPLTEEEWDVMRTCPVLAQGLVDKFDGVPTEVGPIVRASHERWDGSGYPDGLSGPSIPLAARIISCCAAFEAMTTERSYRPRMHQETALRELVNNAGSQFDPHVVRAVIAVVRRSVFTALPELRSRSRDGGLGRAGARSA